MSINYWFRCGLGLSTKHGNYCCQRQTKYLYDPNTVLIVIIIIISWTVLLIFAHSQDYKVRFTLLVPRYPLIQVIN